MEIYLVKERVYPNNNIVYEAEGEEMAVDFIKDMQCKFQGVLYHEKASNEYFKSQAMLEASKM